MHQAAINGKVKAMEKLKEWGADPSAVNNVRENNISICLCSSTPGLHIDNVGPSWCSLEAPPFMMLPEMVMRKL